MINMAGIEANAPQDKSLNLNEEFMSLGRAALLTGIVGGHPGTHVAAFSLPMKKDGGTTRIAPWTACSLWIICFLSSAPISAIIPRFFLGGCFLQVGFGLARTFLWDNRATMDTTSKVIAYFTTFVAIMTDLNWAAAAGFVVVALNFVRLSMNMEVIRAVERVDVCRSAKRRSIEEIRLLESYGHRIMVMYLEGYLFWGTVDEINAAFEGIIDGSEDDPSTIYIDMRYVHGVELSVINAIKKLKRLAGNVGISLIVCSIPSASAIGSQLHGALKSLPFASKSDMETLLEESEDKLIAEHGKTTVSAGIPWPTQGRARAVALTKFASQNLGANVGKFMMKRVFDGWSRWSSQRHSQLRRRRTQEKQDVLRELAMQTESAYAIQWELLDDGELCIGQSYNPPWRALKLIRGAIDKQEKVSTFVTGSAKYFAKPGNDDSEEELADDQVPKTSPLCASFIRKKAFCASVPMLAAKDFPRKELAAKYGINRIFFVPTETGVIELGSLGKPQLTSEIAQSGVMELPEDPANLLDLEIAEATWDKILLRIGLPKCTKTDESVSLSTIDTLPNVVSTIEPTPLEQAKQEPNNLIAGGCLSPNLLLTINTLGTHQKLQEGDVLATPMTASKSTEADGEIKKVKCDNSEALVADTFFIVLEGCVGTFSMIEDRDGNPTRILKSPPGSVIGVEDVWAKQPRSRQLKCLSTEAQVVEIHRSVMKKITTCDSPFVSPESSEEFLSYLMREMALNMLAMH
jgi:hypothetical protein